MEKMDIHKAIKAIQEYDHIMPVNEHPIVHRYRDKDGYIYNYNIFILAEL